MTRPWEKIETRDLRQWGGIPIVGDQPLDFLSNFVDLESISSLVGSILIITQQVLESNQSRIRCHQHLQLMQITPHIGKSESGPTA